jgi:hypothetical protein
MPDDAPPPPSPPQHTGTHRAYLIERLRRGGHADLLAAVESGRLSAYAAAEAAGLVTRRPVLGTGTANHAKRRALAVAREQRASSHAELELWLGPSHHGSLFHNEAELRAAWAQSRDLLMARYAQGGHRPQAWWAFEATDLRYPGYDRERSFLFEHSLLTDAERFELLDWWRKEFEHAFDSDFFVAVGPGQILEGARARREHFRWADPRTLVETWTAERKRRAKTIRGLRKSASSAET